MNICRLQTLTESYDYRMMKQSIPGAQIGKALCNAYMVSNHKIA